MSAPGIFALLLRLELIVFRCVVRAIAPALAVLVVPVAQAAAGPGEAPGARRQPAPADLVKLELVADVTHVTAGKKITLAARFQIAPGWHIYWENPGEAGLATEVAFSAPGGYRIGAVRYPGPQRFQTPGETAASFGYSGDAVLSAPVEVPGRKADEPARFAVEASWLACRDVCIRGQGRASLDLPLASRAQPSRAANAELFGRHREALPRKFSELRAAHRWERDQREARLLVTVGRADKVEYFPPTGEDLQLVSQSAAAAEGAKPSTELRLVYKPGFKPARARGVLAVTKGPERRYYALNLEEVP
jgi:DsbC/DsbD-like thiol-disulfide interchange protein